MPELPEVENTRRYLIEAGLPGSSFMGAEVGWLKALQTPSIEDFVLELLGATVKQVNRLGKYLLLPLHTGNATGSSTLTLHLGMTGGLRLQPATQTPHPMVRHTFKLDGSRELRFIDGRKFAKIWLVDDPNDMLPPLGPDPLGEEFTARVLSESLKDRNAPIKALLLEQSIVAGIGNLYADESLFLSGIHPSRPAAKLSAEEVRKLTDAIKSALATALDAYDKSRVELWPDPPMGLQTWSIPRKEKSQCPRCGGPIAGIRVRSRGTFFCSHCQR